MERYTPPLAETPLPSVLICTADRPDSLIKAVRSVLRTEETFNELLVVDQSKDDRSLEALRPVLGDPRVRYIRDRNRGKGLALNRGLVEAASDAVAITDDDCEVPLDWPTTLIAPIVQNPRVALTYGNVKPAPYVEGAGFIPTHVVTRDRRFTRPWHKGMARGIGANTAVRRSAVLRLGGFDPEMGPGGRFKACIDGDLTLRVLLAGYEVHEVAVSSVEHFGFRDWSEGRKLARNAFYGIGAAHVKPLRRGDLAGIPAFAFELGCKAIGHSLLRLVTLQRPIGAARIGCFVRGAVDGWRHPMDPGTMTYVRSEAAVAAAQPSLPARDSAPRAGGSANKETQR